jgi:hypothetical protein
MTRIFRIFLQYQYNCINYLVSATNIINILSKIIFVCISSSKDDNWEKFRYIDSIETYNNIIEDLQKQYKQTPVTERYTRARILSTMKRAEKELTKTKAEYDKFKLQNARTQISK